MAISELLAVCQMDIRSYAAKQCRAQDIEDAAQESLLSISQGISKLKAVEAFSSWLFTIVKRECHRALRASYRILHWQKTELDGLQKYHSDFELKTDLVKCLQSLPPHYLTVILLRDFEELSVKEIAKELGEDVPAIKSRIHRAREMIRDYLTVK